ncbi:unnamed protein product [Blepharisma stoltei]|uniref:Uncharacterized protein n=1 Tax=Blepharisma stoltei TaxID=1481888 RepID=A0AAU9IFK7_9CILI|nr:unnamed protein product [Blepharisma stoltei]
MRSCCPIELSYCSKKKPGHGKKSKKLEKKSQELKNVKKEQEEFVRQKSEIKTQRERALSEQRSHYNKIREERKHNTYTLKQAILQNKREEAFNVRKQREENIRKKKDMMDFFREENQARKSAIRGSEMSATQRINQWRNQKFEDFKNDYQKRIDTEDGIRKTKEKEVMDMELLEMELIKRLQNTQLIQKQAFEELDTVLKHSNVSKTSGIFSKKSLEGINN